MDNQVDGTAGQLLASPPGALARLAERLARRPHRACCIGIGLAMGGALAIAAVRPLWFDEIFTWEIATRPSLGALLAALGPMDPSPPLHYLLVRAAHALAGTGQVATRLPALVAFLLTLIMLYRLALPLAGPLFALAVVAALPLTPALDYAAEARPYMLLMACAAAALLAWREATAGAHRRAGLCALLLALAAALYAHFYGFLLFVPIAVGEAVRGWRSRRIDLAIWGVMALAAALALPLLPLARQCLALRPTFWATPTPRRLVWALTLFASVGLVAVLAALLAFGAAWRGRRGVAAPPRPAP
ncbi:MAG: glycosyltransferase family 39 protein, partial [Deltaproteobacteria bacterium]|nr:glycosyltransferase family 39 protein [Deltaproteobacteria bacterium]